MPGAFVPGIFSATRRPALSMWRALHQVKLICHGQIGVQLEKYQTEACPASYASVAGRCSAPFSHRPLLSQGDRHEIREAFLYVPDCRRDFRLW